jgi:transposase
MSGKPKRMSQIKQVLQQHQQGIKIKAIARGLAISKNTIKSYLHKIKITGWDIKELLLLEDPVLEARFHAGNPAYSEERFHQFKDRLDEYAEELKKPHVTKRLLWEEYRQQYSDGYGHSQFNFHLLQHIRAKNPSMVLEHKPGEKLFVDFAGKTISYIDRTTGEIIECQLFAACMPYSGYSFILAVPSQKLEDFLFALSQCIVYLGGAPAVIVPDNLKSAIVKASRFEPEVNHALEDFANHHGVVIIPARVRKPKDKALVEYQVHLTYTHVYARLRNQQFFSLEDLNAALQEKNLQLNQTRMQKKPFSREEKFLAEERPLLKALPLEPFQIKHYKVYKVAQNNHIYLAEDRHHYSVPFTYIGQKVKVIYTRSIVQIYFKGKQIASHQRSYSSKVYVTVTEHLCSHHRHYLGRSPQYYIEKAAGVSLKLHELFVLIFKQDKHPEQLYRSCDGLLNIGRKSDKARLDKACGLAIEMGNYTLKFIANVLENNMVDTPTSPPDKPLPTHGNIRGKDHYQNQLTLNID